MAKKTASSKKKKTKKTSLLKELEKSATPAFRAYAKQRGGVSIKVKKQKNGRYKISEKKKAADSARKAIAPGYRMSRNGNIYYESRRNRSDKPGTLV